MKLISSSDSFRSVVTNSSPCGPIGTREPARDTSPDDAITESATRTSAPATGSVVRISSTASAPRSAGSAPASARSPIAATARSRTSAACRSETSRPTASSSGPPLVSTIPQLISPTNSEPSRRRPRTAVENRIGCSVAKYSCMLRVYRSRTRSGQSICTCCPASSAAAYPNSSSASALTYTMRPSRADATTASGRPSRIAAGASSS